MRRTTASIAALGATMVLGLAACDSGSGSNPGVDESSASAGTDAACSLADPPTSTVPPPGSDAGRASGAVAVVVDSSTAVTSDPQTVANDLDSALRQAGLRPRVRVTAADPTALLSGARAVIGSGARFLVLDTLDARTGARVERIAARAGVTVVDFDHPVPGGTAPYLVSYDEEGAGRLQAQSLVDCLTAQGVTDPKLIMLDGGLDIDQNAVLFAMGVHEVLDPLVSAGRATVVEAEVTSWTLADAAASFQQALTAAGGKVDGVLAADDHLAETVLGVLNGLGRKSRVMIAGQGSGVPGLRQVRDGRQTLTVVEDGALEARAAAQLVSALARGQSPESAGLSLRPFPDPQSDGHRLEALLLPAQVVTQANLAGAGQGS
ncbi:substrate-binding domain-containing protein [Nocardioides cynanchi]|uniref:substrate-binding domain-containing protein n=1 Tax=Nocardioides cynanchi TaxID=2558918 RepID=UPI0012479639|nr:substrate-binding domain-containing protein [Nocardioides cynanchi]